MNADCQPPSLAPAAPPPHAWLVVALLWGVACLNYLDRIALTTMRESLMQSIPMSEAQFGLLTSIFLWVYGALSPFAGFLADRIARSRVIAGSLFVWSLATFLAGHARTYEHLLLTRALMGVSEACYLPAALALITDYHRGPTRSLASGLHQTGLSIGAGLSGLGGWLAERHGWSFAFQMFGGVGIAYALVLVFALRDAPTSGRATSATAGEHDAVNFSAALRSLFSERSFFLLLAYWSLIGLAGWGVAGWLPTYMQQQFHLSQGEAGLSATSYLQITTVLGLILGGWCADRRSRATERGRIFVAMAGMALAAPAVFLAAHTHTLGIAIACLMVFGLAGGCADSNTMPILCLVSDARYRATGFGVLNLFANIIGGLTIYAGGVLRDAQVNVSVIFTVAACGLLCCAALLGFIRPAQSTPPPTP